MLLSNCFEDWDDEAIAGLRHLAQLRSASEAHVRSLFPDLFEEKDPQFPPAYDAVLPPDALTEGVECHYGTMPILVTAPHGGYKKCLKGYELFRSPYAKSRDWATAEIARDVRAATNNQLPTVIDLVQRQYRTPETRAYFETQVFLNIAEIRRRLDADHPLLHLDLHGFKPAAGTAGYDLVLGTGHRTTMSGLVADKELADYMQQRGYTVYLPSEMPQAGEAHTADHKNTLVQRVALLALKHTGSIQIEINAAFRTAEHKQDGVQLAQALGEFCLKWADVV